MRSAARRFPSNLAVAMLTLAPIPAACAAAGGTERIAPADAQAQPTQAEVRAQAIQEWHRQQQECTYTFMANAQTPVTVFMTEVEKDPSGFLDQSLTSLVILQNEVTLDEIEFEVRWQLLYDPTNDPYLYRSESGGNYGVRFWGTEQGLASLVSGLRNLRAGALPCDDIPGGDDFPMGMDRFYDAAPEGEYAGVALLEMPAGRTMLALADEQQLVGVRYSGYSGVDPWPMHPEDAVTPSWVDVFTERMERMGTQMLGSPQGMTCSITCGTSTCSCEAESRCKTVGGTTIECYDGNVRVAACECTGANDCGCQAYPQS